MSAGDVVELGDILTSYRAVYDALLEARTYVEQCSDPLYFGEPASRQPKAAATLERVDAALADAGELLSPPPIQERLPDA